MVYMYSHTESLKPEGGSGSPGREPCMGTGSSPGSYQADFQAVARQLPGSCQVVARHSQAVARQLQAIQSYL